MADVEEGLQVGLLVCLRLESDSDLVFGIGWFGTRMMDNIYLAAYCSDFYEDLVKRNTPISGYARWAGLYLGV